MIKVKETNKGITLIALIITIIVLLILAGVVLNLTIGERGIFNTAKESKTAHIIAEMREELELALNDLQLEKQGNATIDDVTQEWADSNKLKEYETIIEDGVDANHKTATMTKDGVTVRFVIDEKLNIIEAEQVMENEQYQAITMNLGEGISIDNEITKTAYDKPYSATVSGEGEYIVETLTVTMGGQPVTVDVGTGKIDIEKVTGDIVITATSKKLELQITGPIVGTSASATESVADNSIVKGTPLYINLSATLEGENCTITYKEDETKTTPYEITDDGTYTFIITGEYKGKTITKEVEVKTNKYKVYKISTPEDFQNINKDLAGYYVVVNDIDMTGFNFSKIGVSGVSAFSGTLDGQGHTISNLTMTGSEAKVFDITNSATIKNILFKELNLNGTGYNDIGLVGTTTGFTTFEKVGVVGTISGYGCVGGLVGYPYAGASFKNCYARVNISARDIGSGGGIAGYASAGLSLENCYAVTKYIGMVPCYSITTVPTINCFYNSDLYIGDNGGYHAYGTGLTTEQFRDSSNFTNWDFTNDWYIDLETGYPELKFN